MEKIDNDGYIGECVGNTEISVFAKTKQEIDDRINTALQGYIDLFPYKVDKMLVTDRNRRITLLE